MNKKMYELGSKRSVIRDLFEYGRALAAKIGEDKVYDFSLGNPSIPAPDCVNDGIRSLIENDATAIHGYTSAVGDAEVRRKISNYVEKEFGFSLPSSLIYMTSGAAAALSIVFKALVEEGRSEFITFAPYFPEYKVFAEAAGGSLKVVPAADENFGINIEGLEKAITEKTIGVVINSPNNPSGNVYAKEEIVSLSKLLKKKSEEYGRAIYLIADEPYREVVYDDIEVPYVMNYYDNSVICYSWSKSMSLAGERIGYIAVSPNAEEAETLFFAVCGAGRALGYVCASSLFQRVCANGIGQTSDIEIYKSNRDLLYGKLTQLGLKCLYPKGAFYLFVKCPVESKVFCEKAKELGLLFVPSESFGVDGWVRIAYCVSPDMLKRSLPVFEELVKAVR